ncbi:MAG: hypothetical protein RL760_962 [Candidatus Eisenbacteria bacterium]
MSGLTSDVVLSVRWIDTDLPRPHWRSTANVRLHPRLQAGLEWNPDAHEVAPLATLFLLTEHERQPSVFLGTSSDRIGSPAGKQAYFVTVAKTVPAWRVAPYVTFHYSEWSERVLVPFGAHVDLTHGFSAQPMYDGHRTHLLGTWANERVSATVIWAWLERAGVAFSVGF